MMNFKKVLVVAPHPDDEVIGIGGFIKKLTDNNSEVMVVTVSGHLPPLYDKEDYDRTINEAQIAHKIIGVTSSEYWEIPATRIGDLPISELNNKFFQLIKDFKPSLVLSPYPDRHIDHRLVFDAVMVATRPVSVGLEVSCVAAYETLSETHWNAPHIESNFIPNCVIDISENINDKLEAASCFESQITPFPGPRSIEAIEALAKFRGTQSGFAYGEGLHIIRLVS